MKRRKAFLKEERLIQIINRAAVISGGDMRSMFTVSQMAEYLDLSATQTRKLINDLIRQGVLLHEQESYPGVCGKRILYGFTEQYIADCELGKYTAKQRTKRTIKINGLQLVIEGTI